MKRKVVIAGGGTGGHLFPSIALAKALKRNDMTIEISFVGTKQGIESSVLPGEGFKLKTIISSGLLGKKGSIGGFLGPNFRWERRNQCVF